MRSSCAEKMCDSTDKHLVSNATSCGENSYEQVQYVPMDSKMEVGTDCLWHCLHCSTDCSTSEDLNEHSKSCLYRETTDALGVMQNTGNYDVISNTFSDADAVCRWKCEHCYASFRSRDKLREHSTDCLCWAPTRAQGGQAIMNESLDVNRSTAGLCRWRCANCSIDLATRDLLLLHGKRCFYRRASDSQSLPSYGCALCPRQYKRKHDLNDHRRFKHEKIVLPRKKMRIADVGKRRSMETVDRTVYMYACDECPAAYKYKTGLSRHRREQHRGDTAHLGARYNQRQLDVSQGLVAGQVLPTTVLGSDGATVSASCARPNGQNTNCNAVKQALCNNEAEKDVLKLDNKGVAMNTTDIQTSILEDQVKAWFDETAPQPSIPYSLREREVWSVISQSASASIHVELSNSDDEACDKPDCEADSDFTADDTDEKQSERKFKCFVCPLSYIYKKGLDRHLRISHSIEPEFKRKPVSKYHDKSIEKTGRSEASIDDRDTCIGSVTKCEQPDDSATVVQSSHADNKHGNRFKALTTKQFSEQHKFKCDICPSSYRYKHGLYRHRRISHDIEPKPRPATRKLSLTTKQFSEQRKFKCNVCSLSYRYKHGLDRHRKTSHNLKPEPRPATRKLITVDRYSEMYINQTNYKQNNSDENNACVSSAMDDNSLDSSVDDNSLDSLDENDEESDIADSSRSEQEESSRAIDKESRSEKDPISTATSNECADNRNNLNQPQQQVDEGEAASDLITQSLTSAEGVKSYICKMCKKRFSTAQKIKFHFKLSVFEKDGFNCPVCDEKFFYLCAYWKHVENCGQSSEQAQQNAVNGPIADKPIASSSCSTGQVTAESSATSELSLSTSREQETRTVSHSEPKQPRKTASVVRPVRFDGSRTVVKTDAAYKCSKCGRDFDKLSWLHVHWLSSCDETADTISTLSDNTQGTENSKYNIDSDPRQIYQCENCGRSFTKFNFLKKHQESLGCGISQLSQQRAGAAAAEREAKNRFHCNLCDRRLPTKARLTIHKRECHSVYKKKCPLCDEVFYSQPRLKDHIVRAHDIPVDSFRCSNCPILVIDKAFPLSAGSTSDRLLLCDRCTAANDLMPVAVLSLDSGNKRFQCMKCDENYKDRKSLHRHFLISHTDKYKKFQCDLCSVVYKHNISLKQHYLLRHPGTSEAAATRHKSPAAAVGRRVSQFVCSLCSERFSLAEDLEVHKKTHGEERPYECTKCTSKFVSLQCLQSHNQTIHDSQQSSQIPDDQSNREVSRVAVSCRRSLKYQCEICGFLARGNWQLRRHLTTIHSKPFFYQCDVCGQKFQSCNSLDKHKLIHLGLVREADHTCDICGLACSDLKAYKSHIMTHSDLRPFKCDDCDWTFRTKHSLIAHVTNRHSDHSPVTAA